MLGDLLRQHLLTETVEVPNAMLDKRGRILQWLLRKKLKVRYMPKFAAVDIRARFHKLLEMTGDEELALIQTFDRIKRKQDTIEDVKLVLSYQSKVENIEILSAMYATVVVKPRMIEKKMDALLRNMTNSDFAMFVERMDKYVKVTEEVEAKIKNSSAPKISRI